MTNTTQTQVQAQRGRPLSDKGRRTKNAVNRFVEQATGEFTTSDVRRAVKQSKVTVRNRLNALLREGAVVVVGSQPGKGRGRPESVYKAVRVASEA